MKETPLSRFFTHPDFDTCLQDEEKIQLAAFDTTGKEPIFIKILVGAGAWLASVFIIVFIVASGMVGNETGAVVLGLFSLILGLAVKKINTTFSTQMSLALVSTAHILITLGVVNIYNKEEIGICLLVHSVLTLLIYPLYKSAIYRFLAPLTMGILAFSWLTEKELPLFFHILILCQIGCITLFFHQTKWSSTFRPLAYSGLFLLPGLLMLNHAHTFDLFNQPDLINMWPSTIIVTISLFLLICHFSDDWKQDQTTRAALLITILLAIFTTPAILTAIGLFILGHGLQKTIITVLAFGYMPLSLTSYYYFMGVDLAHKSWIMMASGLLLLGTRFLLSKIPEQQGECS